MAHVGPCRVERREHERWRILTAPTPSPAGGAATDQQGPAAKMFNFDLALHFGAALALDECSGEKKCGGLSGQSYCSKNLERFRGEL